jgi:hypothetical protein
MKPYTLPIVLFCLLAGAACAAPTSEPVATPTPAVTALTPAAAVTAGPGTAAAPTPTPPSAAPTRVPAATATAADTATPFAVTSTANPTVAGGLVGMWQGDNNSFYLLNKDGTWSWDQKLQQVLTAPENTGRWWIEGDIFRIQDVAGKAPCPPDQIGSYQAQLSGDTLVLTAVADRCGPRIDQTQGRYSRQPAGP